MARGSAPATSACGQPVTERAKGVNRAAGGCPAAGTFPRPASERGWSEHPGRVARARPGPGTRPSSLTGPSGVSPGAGR